MTMLSQSRLKNIRPEMKIYEGTVNELRAIASWRIHVPKDYFIIIYVLFDSLKG